MAERWLPIVGFEGRYEVSDLGRVRSLDRVVPKRTARGPRPDRLVEHSVRGCILSLKPRPSGYVYVALAGHSVAVHRLVLTAFVGPCPPGRESLHDDDVGSNNKLTNLSWGTKSQNRDDARRHGSLPAGERHGRAKLTATQVREIRRNDDLSGRALARRYGVSATAIRAIQKNTHWKGLSL